MSWAGEFRSIGFYKYTDHAGRLWELRHRKGSRQEPDGWFLYDQDGDVVAEFMGAQRVRAQRKAEAFVNSYDVHGDVERAESKRKDGEWQRLLDQV